MDDVALARALHVIAVVIWIGGVSMATTIVLPAVRRGEFGENLIAAFHAIERRFVWQARTALLVVGASGLYMAWRLDLWSRFQHAAFWWMHAMVLLWLVFAFILFVGEPLILRGKFERFAATQPDAAFRRLNRVHWLLLTFGVITIMAAVAGSHGWSIF